MLTHEKKFLAALIDIAVVLLLTLIVYIFVPKMQEEAEPPLPKSDPAADRHHWDLW